jgi:hypothetical protein
VARRKRSGVRLTYGRDQSLRYSGEQGIAISVSERVVDPLEMVDIKDKDRHFLLVTVGAHDGLPKAIVEQRAVG